MGIFHIIVIIPNIIFCVCAFSNNDHLHTLSDGFIEFINSNQNTWTAGRNFHNNTPLKYIYGLMGTYKDYHHKYTPRRNYTSLRKKKYPKNFDARYHWQHCPTLNDIRDQGSCGSCWAVAAASAMTDRVCIHSNGRKNFYFSSQDVLSCCNYCGYGCGGGILRTAWKYYKRNGVVSGGCYNSTQGCKPYEIPPCEHKIAGSQNQCKGNSRTPKCSRKCNRNYNVKYNDDKQRGGIVYRVNKRNIKREMYEFGPVTGYFKVYEDFLHYKNGIYNYTTGKYIGLHSVKLIGWGEDSGVKYWIAANSWNTDWGDNGFFKITSENLGGCGINDNVVVGI